MTSLMRRLIFLALILVWPTFPVSAQETDCLQYDDYLRYVSGLPVPEMGYDPIGYSDLTVKGLKAYAFEPHRGLRIIDLADPAAPVHRGLWPFNSVLDIGGLANIDHFLLMAAGSVYVIDVDDHDDPVLGHTFQASGPAMDVAIRQRLAYIVTGNGTLDVFDINNPLAPTYLSSQATTADARCLAFDGDYLYVGGDGFFQVFNLFFPDSPLPVGSVAVSGVIREVSAAGDLALIRQDWEARLVDLTDPAAPTLIGQPFSEMVTSVDLRGDIGWLGRMGSQFGGTVDRWDLLDPAAPVRIGRDYLYGDPKDLAFANGHLYTANRGLYDDFVYSEGLHVFELGLDAEPPRLGLINLTHHYSYGNSCLMDNWIFVVGETYLATLELSEDGAVAQVGSTLLVPWFGMEGLVVGGHLVIKKWDIQNWWLEVWDLSDPLHPVLSQEGLPNGGLSARGKLLYLATGSGIEVSVMEPTAELQPVGSFWPGQSVWPPLWNGNRAAILASGYTTLLVNFDSPLTPIILGEIPDIDHGHRIPMAYADNLLFTRISRPFADEPHYEDWEVWDVTDPANPQLHATVEVPFHQYVRDMTYRDGLLYVAVERMVQIFDVSDPSQPVNVGHIPCVGRDGGQQLTQHDDFLIVTGYLGTVATHPYECPTVTAVGEDSELPAPDTHPTLTATPNPFNPGTVVSFYAAEAGHAELAVYDLAGRLVDRLLDRPLPAGETRIDWRPDDLASGVYLARLEMAGRVWTQRLVLVK